jgi:multicomponent Na+:H+ antiporter subunit B
VTGLAIAGLNKLFSAVMLFGIYSLLSAALFVALDAVDVAFTEAAVGAGISTILMLGALALTTSRQRQISWHRHGSAIAAVSVTGAVLLYGTADMPMFGDPLVPALTYVVPRYLEQSGSEIGIPNIVTSVLASYRGYDTLGEVTVIFTAAVAVAGRLGRYRAGEDGPVPGAGMAHHLILRVVTKLLLPMILLFALYVQFHGDYGPGGGFQAGVIFAAGFILYGLVFGLESVRKVVPPSVIRILCASGLLLYAGVGVVSLLLGGSFLDYDVLAEDPVSGQHLGIFLVELGVGITVAAAMISLFYAYAAYKGDTA